MDTSFFMLAAIEGRHYAVFTTSLQGGIADEAISITPMVAFEVLGDCRASLRSARNDTWCRKGTRKARPLCCTAAKQQLLE